MKFLITENKLEQIITKYLDDKDFIIEETSDDYYFLEHEDDRYAQIRVRKSDMVCYIYYELIGEIESFFSIKRKNSKDVLRKYVENTLNVKVSKTQFQEHMVMMWLRIPN